MMLHCTSCRTSPTHYICIYAYSLSLSKIIECEKKKEKSRLRRNSKWTPIYVRHKIKTLYLLSYRFTHLNLNTLPPTTIYSNYILFGYVKGRSIEKVIEGSKKK